MTENDFKGQVFAHMLSTRGDKYVWFLRALRSFRFFAGKDRAEFLESYYAYMRFIDDVVDGDAPLPPSYKDSESFVSDKIRFADNPIHPRDALDGLLLHCIQTGKGFGQDFSMETQDILYSMLFDARRMGKRQVFPEKELIHHFHMLDVRGTIKATLKVFNEEAGKYELLAPLGMATRIYYNLRDYEEDLGKGLINISQEDCQRFGIKSDNLETRASTGVNDWFRDQSEQGLKLIQEHNQNLPKAKFRYLSRITLKQVYKKPATKYFERILQE